MGAVTNEFEEHFAKKMNVKYAFAVSNCTAALHLANITVGIKKNDDDSTPRIKKTAKVL